MNSMNSCLLYISEDMFNSILNERNVWGAVGVHPKCAGDYTPEIEQQMIKMLRHPKVVALGEIGLDYSGRLVV